MIEDVAVVDRVEELNTDHFSFSLLPAKKCRIKEFILYAAFYSWIIIFN